MRDSNMSRDDLAKFIRQQRNEYRRKMRLANIFERDAQGLVTFEPLSEMLVASFASAEYRRDLIVWRRAELEKVAR